MSQRNLFYAQSGGVTPVINASAAGVIQTARAHPRHFGKVLAGQNGIVGALKEELIDTSRESRRAIDGLMTTPGGAFGSCRYKLRSFDENRAEYERLIEVFRAHNIGYFLYNGGGDSADTCLKVSQISEQMGYPIQAIHVPKTIDNDLPLTDNCPGFGSVAKYVAISTREAALDIESMCATSTKVFILEVMGRHAGWIAGASALAGCERGDAPHIILFPEIAFDQEKIPEQSRPVREALRILRRRRLGRAPAPADGRLLSDQGERDAFGHAQLGGLRHCWQAWSKTKLGYKHHWAVRRLPAARCAPLSLARPTSIRPSRWAKQAVELALEGANAGDAEPVERRSTKAVSLGHRYRARCIGLPNREKKMPRRFISKDGFGVTGRGADPISSH
jgi:6-phosphofructokinase 1